MSRATPTQPTGKGQAHALARLRAMIPSDPRWTSDRPGCPARIWIDRFVSFAREVGGCDQEPQPRRGSLRRPLPGLPRDARRLILEGLAQTGGILVGQANNFEKNVVLAKITAKFHREALAGEQLTYSVSLLDLNDTGARVERHRALRCGTRRRGRDHVRPRHARRSSRPDCRMQSSFSAESCATPEDGRGRDQINAGWRSPKSDDQVRRLTDHSRLPIPDPRLPLAPAWLLIHCSNAARVHPLCKTAPRPPVFSHGGHVPADGGVPAAGGNGGSWVLRVPGSGSDVPVRDRKLAVNTRRDTSNLRGSPGLGPVRPREREAQPG